MLHEIDTPAKRARLAPRKNPYWFGIGGGRGGVSLGYRKPTRGGGSWVAKLVIDGQRTEERLGRADDLAEPTQGVGYRNAVAIALEWSKQQHAAFEGKREAGANRKALTVGSAVEAYLSALEKRSASAASIARGRLTKHVLADPKFAGTKLAKLRAQTIEDWRGRLLVREASLREPKGAAKANESAIAPASVNRLLNDIRAALNAMCEKHRRELPPHLSVEIKVGTRALSLAGAARKQILPDPVVRQIVEAAHTVDETGDFGRLVLLAAATGARYSQITALKVRDVQFARGRLMVPGSAKGRAARAKPAVPVPLSAEVLERLKIVTEGREESEPLLMRWGFRNIGPLKWERDKRRPWGLSYDTHKLWAATLKAASAPPDVIMYALRHSSIVRGLVKGLPVRLVASLHDTSIAMIEAHYSAYIAEATDEIARRAVLILE